jgi:hypothetical protein
VAVQERLYRSQVDCEINILCCLARRFGNLNRVQLTRNNANDLRGYGLRRLRRSLCLQSRSAISEQTTQAGSKLTDLPQPDLGDSGLRE